MGGKGGLFYSFSGLGFETNACFRHSKGFIPSAFLHSYQMMRRCWADNPDARPTFTELCQELEDWIQREIPYLDMDQLNEDQPYYEASATASLSSGSSYDRHAPEKSLPSNTLACDEKEVTSESTNV